MSHVRVLFWTLLIMLVTSLVGAGPAGDNSDIHFIGGLAIGYLCFLWYRGDSEARGVKRSRWLNTGIVVLAVCAIPWYLLKSRPVEERGGALLIYLSYLLLVMLASWAGMAARAAIS